MQGEAVFLRIDGHGAEAKLIGGAEDAYSDFAAVGSEQFTDRFGLLHLRGNQGVARNSTLFHGDNATRLQFFRFEEQIVFVIGRRRRLTKCGTETGFKHLFGLWRRRPELENLERAELGNQLEEESEKTLSWTGLAIILAPFALIV